MSLLCQLTSHNPIIQILFSVLLDNYNLNYLNTEEKESLDTILTTYNLEVVNNSTPTHSKTLID